MPNVIQHNAANILALSMLFFLGAVVTPDNKSLALMPPLTPNDLLAEPVKENATQSLTTTS